MNNKYKGSTSLTKCCIRYDNDLNLTIDSYHID